MPRDRRAASIAAGVMVFGLIASLLLTRSAATRNADEFEDWLADRGQVVAATIESTVEVAIDGLSALAAFFENSQFVDQDEFGGFVGSLAPVIRLVGVGYIAVVPADELDAEIARMQQTYPDYVVASFDADGVQHPVMSNRDVYFPVEAFYTGPLVMESTTISTAEVTAMGLGYDAGSAAEWRPSFEATVADDAPAVSGFVELGDGETPLGNAFIVSVPVHDDRGEVVGLVTAPMVDFLLAAEVDLEITNDVSWTITSGDPSSDVDEQSWVTTIVLPGIVWDLVVVPTKGAPTPSQMSPWIVLLAGLGVTGLVAYLLYLADQRSRVRGEIDEMERVSREKDRFLASVSHEIRTPLTVVSGLAHELRDRSQDFQPGEVEELLSMIARQSDEVSAIVEDLLVAARADIGRVAITPQLVDLEHAVTVVLEGTGVEASVVGRGVGAWADPNRVRQILRNLVSNAGRYGGQDKKVVLGSDEVSSWVEVMDSGPPIPMGERSTMFEAYATSPGGSNSNVASIGLGLFISHRLAELLGGRLTYHHDGSYGVFKLQLPATEQAAADSAI